MAGEKPTGSEVEPSIEILRDRWEGAFEEADSLGRAVLAVIPGTEKIPGYFQKTGAEYDIAVKKLNQAWELYYAKLLEGNLESGPQQKRG